MSEYDDVVAGGPNGEAVDDPSSEPLVDGKLPPDIEEIWGGGRLDGTGNVAADTARFLIGRWGVDGFRGSQLHQMAVLERRHTAGLDPLRTAYLKNARKP